MAEVQTVELTLQDFYREMRELRDRIVRLEADVHQRNVAQAQYDFCKVCRMVPNINCTNSACPFPIRVTCGVQP